MGRDFLGCYDVIDDKLVLMKKGHASGKIGDDVNEDIVCQGVADQKLDHLLPSHSVEKLREEVPLATGLCPPLDMQAYRDGTLSPVFLAAPLIILGSANCSRAWFRWHPRHALKWQKNASWIPKKQSQRFCLQNSSKHGPQTPRPNCLF